MSTPVGQPPGKPQRPAGLARLKRKFLRIWVEVRDDEVFDRAAALSCYFIFALFPLLLVVTAALGLLRPDLIDTLMTMLDTLLPTDVARRTMAVR